MITKLNWIKNYLISILRPIETQVIIVLNMSEPLIIDNETPETQMLVRLQSHFNWLKLFKVKNNWHIEFYQLDKQETKRQYQQFITFCRWHYPKLISSNTLIIVNNTLSTLEAECLKYDYIKFIRRPILSIYIDHRSNKIGLDQYLFIESTNTPFREIDINKNTNEFTTITNILQNHWNKFQNHIAKNMSYYLSQCDNSQTRIRMYQLTNTIDQLSSISTDTLNKLAKHSHYFRPIRIGLICIKLPMSYPIHHRHNKKTPLIIAILIVVTLSIGVSQLSNYFNRSLNTQASLLQANTTTMASLNTLYNTIPNELVLDLFFNYKEPEDLLAKLTRLRLQQQLKPLLKNELTSLDILNNKQLATLLQTELVDTNFKADRRYPNRATQLAVAYELPTFSYSSSNIINSDLKHNSALKSAYKTQQEIYWDYYLHQQISSINSIPKLMKLLQLKFDLPNTYDDYCKLYQNIKSVRMHDRSLESQLLLKQLKNIIRSHLTVVINKHRTLLTSNPFLFYREYLQPLNNSSLTSSISHYFSSRVIATSNFIISLSPAELSVKAKSASLTIGNLTLTYAHGPSLPYTINLSHRSNCNLTIDDFDHHTLTNHYLFDACVSQLIQNNQPQFCINKLCLTFSKLSASSMAKIKLKKLQLHPPQHIVIGEQHGTTH